MAVQLLVPTTSSALIYNSVEMKLMEKMKMKDVTPSITLVKSIMKNLWKN